MKLVDVRILAARGECGKALGYSLVKQQNISLRSACHLLAHYFGAVEGVQHIAYLVGTHYWLISWPPGSFCQLLNGRNVGRSGFSYFDHAAIIEIISPCLPAYDKNALRRGPEIIFLLRPTSGVTKRSAIRHFGARPCGMCGSMCGMETLR